MRTTISLSQQVNVDPADLPSAEPARQPGGDRFSGRWRRWA